MMADHGTPCDASEAGFCFHGGTCYKISSVSTLTCVCNDGYKGSRCEQFPLPSLLHSRHDSGLIVAVVIVILLVLVVVSFIIYLIYKMCKTKPQHHQ